MSSSTASGSAARKQPTAVSRMKQDYMRLKRDPLPYITAEPLPNNILEWHYCVKGPEDSPYYGGYYHGTLLFPREFPFKPPSIYMLTPNGRFKTNTRLCLSISDFHPDTWNPTWCVGTILTGLLSFMLESTPTLGSIESSSYDKQMFAQKSLAFNLRNANFCELFPDIVNEIKLRLQSTQAAATAGKPGTSSSSRANGLANGSAVAIDKRNKNASSANGQLPLPTDGSPSDGLAVGTAASADVGSGGAAALKNSARNSYLNWQSIYSNLVIIICFAIFALIVNYVIKNLNQE
ncbi:ubiquitin-conjugating enzyme E2 J2 [Drosophila novamexicana]|uniref:ubiquitin-conjugating enzyme E2 J2 n=1 Tax=Drosophila novamexicana TaxID=47314 RepID=UPI0011E59281|nr:ubiquitin-conjugating enzyme E2 J2 [Drosophila novamexicana]XP_030573775.1 ubiquitin-conjugating enzyme E2 J2 [Drosophila novamexicana]XP_030573777.1 ubiquitin-conjugating enzyme E2 J2 [Drosophila novamexicana]XP_030573778.1 ubiquitin-conjugating enzyme E2 J2 [Drosophila novamexicana]